MYTYLILDPMFCDHKKLAYNKREDMAFSDVDQSFTQIPEEKTNEPQNI